MKINLNAVGQVFSTRSEIYDDDWDKEKVFIKLDEKMFNSEALQGLSEFSHAEIIFYMDQVDEDKIQRRARHPRNQKNWPTVGIFAQRGKNRPNRIGSTICKILKVDGVELYISGLDAIDGTPVLDIKPWVLEFGPRGEIEQPQWMTELMSSYWD